MDQKYFRFKIITGFCAASLILFFACSSPTDSSGPKVEEGDVLNPVTGKVWMDRNLGASRVATSPHDNQAYGDLYQWGRATDGHQTRNSSTSTVISSSNRPGGRFIISNSDANWDWRNPQNNSLWRGVDGENNPCPSGYRIPTQAEWNTERNTWDSATTEGAFASPLKLPAAGGRSGSTGQHSGGGFNYWSSSVSGSFARVISISENYSGRRSGGYAVRCIKD